MQRCPKCYRTYQNDNQKYCTACGGRLVPDEEVPTSYGLDDTAATYTSTTPSRIESAPATGFDPNLTVRVPAPPPPPPVFDPNKTVANVPPPPRQAPETVAVNLAESNLPPTPEAPATEESDSRIAATISLIASPPITEPPLPVIEEVAVIMPEPPEDVPVAVNVETPEIVLAAPALPISSPFADTLHGAEEEAEPEEITTPEAPPPMPTVALDSVPLPAAVVEPEILPEPEPVSLPPTPAEGITAPPPVVAPEPPPVVAPELPPAPANVKAAAATAGKNHLPLILGILFALGLIVVAGAAGAYFLVIKPRLEANKRLAQPTPEPTPAPTPEAQSTPTNDNPGGANPTATPKPGGSLPTFDAAPPNTVEFTNKKEKLRGTLAQHFVDFTFYYPNAWKLAAPDAAFFAEVSNSGADGVPQEDFALGWYESSGTFALDEAGFAARVEKKSAEIAKKLPGYKKLAEGTTKINGADAYQFSYQGQATDSAGAPLTFWGRVIFLPPNVENQKNGVIMYLTATSKSPAITNIDDVGEKGEMPIILNSFRFGKRQE